jgi:ubiquinone/menaquinone biosynthesis C-methylase UbiE
MVKKAESLNVGSINPLYIVADMRDIGSLFAENTFAAAWCTASLIHIPVNETDKVLAGLRRVTKPGSLTYIGLKGGPTETKIVTENKYNLSIVREFTFWEKEDFAQLVRESGFSIFDYDQEISGLTDNKPTSWLNFTIRNEK